MFDQEYTALKKIGKSVIIYAYKFNGWLYRSWEYPIVIANEDDYIVLSNFDTNILTSEYNSYRVFNSTTKYPSFWVFFKNEWFNLVITIIKDRPQYYINVSSKFIYEESSIKYIDFDLDYRVFSNGSWTEVDMQEFRESIVNFNYPEPLIFKIKQIEEKIENYIKEGYFTKTFGMEKLNNYIKIYNEQIERTNHEQQ